MEKQNKRMRKKVLFKKIIHLKHPEVEYIGPKILIDNCDFIMNNYLYKAKEMDGEIKYIDNCGAKVSYYIIDDYLVIKSDHLDEVKYDKVDLRYVIYEGITKRNDELVYFYFTKLPMPLSNAVHYDGFVFDSNNFYPAFRDKMDEDFELLNYIESACDKREQIIQNLKQKTKQEQTI